MSEVGSREHDHTIAIPCQRMLGPDIEGELSRGYGREAHSDYGPNSLVVRGYLRVCSSTQLP